VTRDQHAAFLAQLDLHKALLYKVANAYCPRREDRGDLIQEIVLELWRAWPRYDGRAAVSTWMHRIAVNAVLAKRRGPQGRNEISMTDESGEQMDFESDAAMDEATPIDIERAIAALSPGARDVVVLHGIYGYSHEEAAEMLGVAVGTCKAQLHRARHLMRSRMGEENTT